VIGYIIELTGALSSGATIEFPFPLPQTIPSQDAGDYLLQYIGGSGTWETDGTITRLENGSLYANLTHFSMWRILCKNSGDSTVPTGGGGGGGGGCFISTLRQ
jgi:hypothetical protein